MPEPSPEIVEALFQQAIDLDLDRRGVFLDEKCADDPDLRAAVEDLLRFDAKTQGTPGFLREAAAGARRAAAPASPPGYELIDEIGRGGMGVVYRARHTALDRDVAVKLLSERYAADSPFARRFLNEARITGQLQHPGIPAVHHVGTLPDGRPFLAMKLIKGSTLQAILRQRPDPSADRGRLLAVFEAVCQAVGYAHSHGVIHRDLKPANVMVGAFGEVQVMDWGLAKVLGPTTEVPHEKPTADGPGADTLAWTQFSPTPDDGSQTQAGSVVGTPAYIAPEQAVGEVERVTARSDVFGLGALLAVILTGKPPYVGETAEAVRVQAVRGKLEDCFVRLDGSGTEPEWVALCKQCLAFEPEDRPTDAGAVAAAVADLRAAADERARRAELERVRVEGEQATAAARAAERRKRRRLTLGAAAVLALAVVSGLSAVLAVQRRANADLAQANADERAANQRERTAREQAQTNFTLAQGAVGKYLNEVTSDPDLKKADFNKLRKKLLETGVPFYETLAQQHADNPALGAERGSAYRRLADLRNEMGDPRLAVADLEQAGPIFARLAEQYPDRPEYRKHLAETLNSLAIARFGLGQTAGAAEALREAARAYQQLVAAAPDNADYRALLANCQNNLGVTLQNMGRPTEAEAAYRQALALREKLVDDSPKSAKWRRSLGRTLNSLAVLADDQGKLDESERYQRQAVQIREQLVAEDPNDATDFSDLAISYSNLGNALSSKGNRAEAVALSRKAVAVQKRVAERFPTVAFYRVAEAKYLRNLGIDLEGLGRSAEARGVFLEAAALLEKLLADAPAVPEHRFDLGRMRAVLARSLTDLGRFEEAQAELHKAIPLIEKACAAAPDQTAWSGELGLACVYFGRLFLERGDPAAGLPWFARAVDTLNQCTAKNPGLADARQYLTEAHAERAEVLDRLGRHAEAMPDWDRAIELAGPGRDGVYRSFRMLSAGKPAEATAAADEAARAANASGESLHQLARVFALASAACRGQPEEARYAARTVELLRKSARRKHDPSGWMQHDSALAGLRARPDFQKLAEELAAKQKVEGR
jgi:serine/threonine protein kinase/tetratricopeptide (TPR) repeat protein